MDLQEWGNVLAESFRVIWGGVFNFIPKLVVAIVIFLAGWVVGSVLARLVSQVISAIKVDSALRSIGTEDLLAKAGFRLNSGQFIGDLVKWFIIVVFLVASLNVLGLTEVNIFFREVVLNYLPNVIAAALILVLAAVIAEALRKIVVGSAKAASMPSAKFLGGVARWSIWIFAILAALSQLGIAGAFAQTLFTGLIAMLALAGGLAFGLGGREAAARYLEKIRQEISD